MRKHINTFIWGVGVCGALEQGTETYLRSPVCTLMGWGPSWRKELNQGVISAICTPPPPRNSGVSMPAQLGAGK